ncbi:MAG: glutamine synthetase [Verrucomicrobiales bacterium]|jgi:glutamine synthetase
MNLIEQYEKNGIKRVKLAFTDIDGVHRGKYVSLAKFASILKSGAGFCDCVLGWDIDDQLYDNAKFTGWHTAFPDAHYEVDPASERRLIDENGTPLLLLNFVGHDGGSHPICPRSLLKRVLAKADAMGFGVNLAFEYEFFVFNETAHSIRDKGYRDLEPLTPGNFGYSILRSSSEADLFHELMDYCESMQFPLEGLHCETGPGVWEAALTYNDALTMADSAALFKTFTKVFFQKRDLLATFMAKWSMDYPGQSGHVHQSLTSKDSGANVFHDADKPHQMSDLMRHYIAGQQQLLKPFLAMSAPTINSYTRLVKGFWAPTTATWGIDNRTCALRAIPGTENSQRLEFRLGAADGNPYLVAAANIAAGLTGIERKLTPSDPVQGNAYEVEDSLPAELQLATNLRDATRDFKASKDAVDAFGADFVEHFASSREWEVREYERHVNDWQLQRYFELI